MLSRGSSALRSFSPRGSTLECLLAGPVAARHASSAPPTPPSSARSLGTALPIMDGASLLDGVVARVPVRDDIASMGVSPTLGVNMEIQRLREQGHPVFNFGLGQSPFPVPKLLQDSLREHAGEKDYLPVFGLAKLRSAVAASLERDVGVPVDRENVMVGPGSKELLYIAQLVHDAPLVLPSPAWVTYAPQARMLRKKVHWIPTSLDKAWKVDPEQLDSALYKSGPRSLFIMNYPSNPTGVSYSDDELAALADVLRYHQAIVISDQIYGHLNFRGNYASIARYYPEGTIISDGISKWVGAGGWRMGFFAIPPELRPLQDAMAVVASETFSSVSAPIQYASVAAYEDHPDILRYKTAECAALKMITRTAVNMLNSVGARCVPPDGAYYVFPDLGSAPALSHVNGRVSSVDVARWMARKRGFVCLPGTCFGRPENELTFRMSLVDFDGEKVIEALEAAREKSGAFPEGDELLQCIAPHTDRLFRGLHELCDLLANDSFLE